MTVMLLVKTPAVLSLGKLEEFGYSYHWTSDQKPTSNHVPFVVPTVTDTEIPATRRSESMSEESLAPGTRCIDQQKSENQNKDADEELQSDELQGVPDWLQEFKHGLVDESVREHRHTSSSSHELPLEPRAKV